MRNTMNAVRSIRPLGDEELSEVSGGHGWGWRRHAHGHRHDIQRAPAEPAGGGMGDLGGLGGLGALLQLLTQVNMGAIIQLVFGNNNTVIAGLSQNNASQ